MSLRRTVNEDSWARFIILWLACASMLWMIHRSNIDIEIGNVTEFLIARAFPTLVMMFFVAINISLVPKDKEGKPWI